jgi:hypothetical protein
LSEGFASVLTFISEAMPNKTADLLRFVFFVVRLWLILAGYLRTYEQVPIFIRGIKSQIGRI